MNWKCNQVSVLKKEKLPNLALNLFEELYYVFENPYYAFENPYYTFERTYYAFEDIYNVYIIIRAEKHHIKA